MERNYTEAVRDGFFDLIENDLVDIWNKLGNRKETIAAGKWKEHYSEVVSRYRCSCRFALMRILLEKAIGRPYYQINENDLLQGYSLEGIGEFRDITISHAQNLVEEELLQYKRLLLRRVEEHNPTHLDEATVFIEKAMTLSTTALSKEELLHLGHLVDFSLDDMQFMLLRVLGDNEAGFAYSSSSDVIDMYGFICGLPVDTVVELKAWYYKKTKNHKKVDYEEKTLYCTQDIANSFEEAFKEMTLDGFRSWLIERAPTLDIKSKTARKIYLNLAAYTYALLHPELDLLKEFEGVDFYNDIKRIAGLRGYDERVAVSFFTNTKLDLAKCENYASDIIYENAEYASGFHSHTDNSELMHHVPYLKNGSVDVRGKQNKNSKQRIVDILMDVAAPTKSDILYLLWVLANNNWIAKTTINKTYFLDEFLAAASCVLRAALLADFYPPHVLEQTLMLGIVCGNEEKTPAMVYESICSEFTNKGAAKKQPGSTKKDPTFRKSVAEWVYSYMEQTGKSLTEAQEACAAHYTTTLNCKLSYSSVYNYCKENPRKQG